MPSLPHWRASMSRISPIQPPRCGNPSTKSSAFAQQITPHPGRSRAHGAEKSPGLAALLHAVPPGADAGHEIVVAGDHLDRLALTVLGGLDAQPARLLLLFRRHPTPLMTPQAWTKFALERLPGGVVDELAAPAVLD